MENLNAEQHLKTSKEYLKFCMYVIDKEMKRFNLDYIVYKSFLTQLTGTLDVNFDIAYYRCAFMYKYTLCNLYFFKDCMDKFLLKCTEFQNVISKWSTDSNIQICSLSCGPGLDCLSFVLALSDHFSAPLFKSLTILSKHGAWRNTVGMIADALEEGTIFNSGEGKLFKNTEVVQANILASIPMKGFEALGQSSVILMSKTLNLTAPALNEEIVKTKLLELISSLKPETLIFFIDTKPSLILFLEVLSKCPGKFLYEPEHLSFKVPITFSDDYKVKLGSHPVASARGAFLVWQKLSTFQADLSFNISTMNPFADVNEISQSLLESAYKEHDEVLTITKTLKDLILPNNKNIEPDSVKIANDSQVNDNMKESMSTASSFVHGSNQAGINKSTSVQALLTNQPIEVESFDEQSSSFHSLRKSTSIDNSFFQGHSLRKSLLGESNILQNYPSHTSRDEEIDLTGFTQSGAIKKKHNETNAASERNETSKLTLDSKATQTELYPSISNSSLFKNLTARIQQLVSSLEKEIQKNIPNDQMNYHLDGIPNRSTNNSFCSASYNDNCSMDIKPPCFSGSCNEEKHPVNCCDYVQNDIHCCATRHNKVHHCGMHCKSCFHQCNINPFQLCENNISSSATNVVPQIVIPLENISNETLLKIISAIKSGSKC